MVTPAAAARRGEVWLANLDPTVGSEVQKSRPCVVISPDELNAHLRTVIVAPMTSKGFAAPFRIPVTHAGTRGLIVLDQLRTVDRIRLARRLGAVSARTLDRTLATLQEVFAR
ncbi:type II toxin-antitoxin system PemK/MazF family toxin [Xylophilus sp.]|uniref:type II toxin-antitoxin system PemK/MazF family toxin n=1 Tax=Xylophilus sp. TaxID=2653893 RepID=UPI0013B5FA2F|nr:type II toxin-antitoxin system PemK/MazF family toxin [Xylophilus sp.]KAF1043133.1 MAG: Endoribonuclease PemK [Xylophilus sp.]